MSETCGTDGMHSSEGGGGYKPSMEVYAQKSPGKEDGEFKDSVGYIVHSRTAWPNNMSLLKRKEDRE